MLPVASVSLSEPQTLAGGGIWGPEGTGLVTVAVMVVAAATSSPRYASDLEQARPQTSGEEELQLQLALAMSREEAEKVRPAPRSPGAGPPTGPEALWGFQGQHRPCLCPGPVPGGG